MGLLKLAGRIPSWAPFLLIIALYLSSVVLSFNQISEDAFIYLRVAANIAEGNGYVFNVGGEHIETGSSLLWQLMLVPLHWLPLDPIISLKFLGIGFGCLALYISYRLSWLLIEDSVLRNFPSIFLAMSAPFFCWSHRGLETPFYLCALLGFCYVCLHERLREYWYLPAMIVFCARPEGFMILLAPLACLVTDRTGHTRFWRGFGFLVLGCGAITLGRLWYFHDPIPYSFYLKAGGDPSVARADVVAFFSSSYLVVLVIPLMIGLFRRRFWNRRVIYVMAFFMVTGLWALVTAERLQPFHRHLLPFIAFFVLASVTSLDLWTVGRKARIGLRLALAVLALAMFPYWQLGETGVKASNFLINAKWTGSQHPEGYVASLVQLIENPSASLVGLNATSALRGYINTNYQATAGKFLHDNYPENITFVYDQMGQTPWYAGSDKVVIDSFGLTTRATGYHSFYGRARKNTLLDSYSNVMESIWTHFWPDEQRMVGRRDALDYVFDRGPELILLNKFVVKFNPRSLTAAITRDHRLASGYKRAYIVNDFVVIYERNDIYSAYRTQIPIGATVENLASDEQRSPRQSSNAVKDTIIPSQPEV